MGHWGSVDAAGDSPTTREGESGVSTTACASPGCPAVASGCVAANDAVGGEGGSSCDSVVRGAGAATTPMSGTVEGWMTDVGKDGVVVPCAGGSTGCSVNSLWDVTGGDSAYTVSPYVMPLSCRELES